MNRKLHYLIQASSIIFLLASFAGCGGGANDEPDGGAAFITVNFLGLVGSSPQDNNEVVEVEMTKNVSATSGVLELKASRSFPDRDLDPKVATIVMDSFEISFTRTDGGSPGLPTLRGPMDATMDANRGTIANNEIPLVTAIEKVYGALGQSFMLDPRQIVDFQAKITCYGHNLNGTKVQASTGIHLQCATYLPYDDLFPVIYSFNHTKDFELGQDWLASWLAGGMITNGYLISPFGSTYALGGFDFPAGDLLINTGHLLPQYTNSYSVLFSSPVLVVQNDFGSAQMEGGSVFARVPGGPSVDPVKIEQFFASRYSISLGESVSLSWVVENGPTGLGMIPETFSGVPVSFEGKNLAFDSVVVTPEASVRPILRATKTSNSSEDHAFLDSAISVSGGTGPADPTIVFFSASHTTVSRYQQVSLFWKIVGDYEKVELFPINGQVKEVTGRESYLTPPLNRLGSNPFRLSVTGVGGNIVASATISITVGVEEINLPVVISNLVQSPGSSITNGSSGAFSWRMDDPEHEDVTWVCQRLAGDLAFFGPNQGRVDGGHGDGSVSFQDQDGDSNGFITFQVSAYDNTDYGITPFTNRTIQLVTFNTNGTQTYNSPVISGVLFTPGSPGNEFMPGQDGVLSFTVTDTDTDQLAYTVSIIAGDRGGTLNGSIDSTSGSIIMGGSGVAPVVIQFQDDPDSTDDAVVFKIEVTEMGPEPRQTAIAILRVPYVIEGSGIITFPHIGLYNNATGAVTEASRIAFYLNYTGTSTAVPGAFFVDHDLTIPAPTLSMVLDLIHGSGNEGSISSLEFARNFITPSSDNENYGECGFLGYFDFPGSTNPPLGNPDPADADSVSRWGMIFDVTNFQSNSGGTYNLPIVNGQVRLYTIDFTGTDKDNIQEDVLVSLRVESVN